MDVKELRIGNRVEILGEERVIETISNLPARGDMYWVGTKGLIDVKMIHVRPIPLTMDNLEELGFTYDESTDTFHWKHSHWLRVQMFPKGGGILLISGKQHTFLDYVHEVQNVFSTLLKENL